MDDATLVLDRDMSEPELHRLADGCAAVFSDRSPGKETPNEDAAALLPIDAGSAVLAVADGLGSQPAGERGRGAGSALPGRRARAAGAQRTRYCATRSSTASSGPTGR